MKPPLFTLRGFRRPREAFGATLGRLERDTLEEVWRRGEVSVRELHEAFGARAAYTTLMTTLDRLYKKRLLARRKEGRAYLYSALHTREEFERGVAGDVLDSLFGSGASAEPVLACIVDTVSDRDRELLDELERLIKEKKREIGRAD